MKKGILYLQWYSIRYRCVYNIADVAPFGMQDGNINVWQFGKKNLIMPGTRKCDRSWRAMAVSHASESRVCGQCGGVIVKMSVCLMSLTAVHTARMIVLPGSVYHRVKSLLVGVVADNPKAATRIFHTIFAGYAASYRKE